VLVVGFNCILNGVPSESHRDDREAVLFQTPTTSNLFNEDRLVRMPQQVQLFKICCFRKGTPTATRTTCCKPKNLCWL